MTLDSLAHIPAPAEAQHVAEWVDEHGGGKHWGRYVRGTRRATAGITVTLCGWQDATGDVERSATVSADAEQLDAVLKVAATIGRISGQLVISAPKTERSRRTVPLSPAVVELLRKHRATQAAERLRQATGGRTAAWCSRRNSAGRSTRAICCASSRRQPRPPGW